MGHDGVPTPEAPEPSERSEPSDTSDTAGPPARAPRATWLWAPARHPRSVVTFLLENGVEDVFLGVGWDGPNADTARTTASLKAAGVRVAALGGSHEWAEDPALAGEWASRLGRSLAFDGIHLDIEPWCHATWPGNEARLLRGLAHAVGHVRKAQPDLAIEIDVPAWLATDHPRELVAIVTLAHAATITAYRDRTTAILAFSSAARDTMAGVGRPYRVAVETRAIPDGAGQTFFDDGRAVLERETGGVVRALGEDVWFRGIAVHDVDGWRALRP